MWPLYYRPNSEALLNLSIECGQCAYLGCILKPHVYRPSKCRIDSPHFESNSVDNQLCAGAWATDPRHLPKIPFVLFIWQPFQVAQHHNLVVPMPRILESRLCLARSFSPLLPTNWASGPNGGGSVDYSRRFRGRENKRDGGVLPCRIHRKLIPCIWPCFLKFTRELPPSPIQCGKEHRPLGAIPQSVVVVVHPNEWPLFIASEIECLIFGIMPRQSKTPFQLFERFFFSITTPSLFNLLYLIPAANFFSLPLFTFSADRSRSAYLMLRTRGRTPDS